MTHVFQDKERNMVAVVEQSDVHELSESLREFE
jgi:hypothetical protein